MLTEAQTEEFNSRGYLVLNNFLSINEADVLKAECQRIVSNMKVEEHAVFKTGDSQVGNDYFLTSGDKIRFFFEEKAFDESGNLSIDKTKALNKIGHALHWLNPKFKEVTYDDRIKQIAKDLKLVDPVVVQSMYIFKHPNIGGEVIPHQDATYLYTVPQSVVGFWIALEDTTTENGCLYFSPGSHQGKLARRMIRNPDKNPSLIHTAPDISYKDVLFEPVPVKKGSLVLIHGLVVHKSGVNTTTTSREIYTFHIMDQHECIYPKDNWLQPTKELPFPSLFHNNA